MKNKYNIGIEDKRRVENMISNLMNLRIWGIVNKHEEVRIWKRIESHAKKFNITINQR